MKIPNNIIGQNNIIWDFYASSLFPQIGIELEFYLTQNQLQIQDQEIVTKFINQLGLECKNSGINLLKIEPEQGTGQIEIKTFPSKNLDKISSDLYLVKVISEDLAKKQSFQANFEPTPFEQDCSSALQLNLTILDQNGKNLFVKNREDESQLLLNSISGLLQLLPKNIEYFSKITKNNPRFDLKRNKELFLNKKYTAPVNLSWGYDNRSCAIRIVGKDENRRLEFRVADANIEPETAIREFLKMVKYGIDQDLKAPSPTYGNAFDYKELEKLF